MLFDSEKFETHKKEVQSKIKLNFGVRVDQVLQGHGTTNTGNLSGKFFDNLKKFSKSTCLNKRLVCNIATIISIYGCKKLFKQNFVEILC